MTLDPRRFPSKRAGRLQGEALARVEETVRYCLGL